MKRIISFVMVLAMLLSCMPLSVFATEDTDVCTVRVENVEGTPGSTVKMSVVIENNPGILGATLKLSWDSGLTLTDVKCGNAFNMLTFTKPKNLKSGCIFTWYGEALYDDEIADGSILDLTFAVDPAAEFGTSYGVSVSYVSGDFFDKDLNLVDPEVVNGGIDITYLPGDVNGDKRINAMDLTLLCRFIADGSKNDPDGYNTNINELAGDVDANGRWNALDLTLICRYIADGCKTDLDGYNVTLKHSGMVHTHRMTAFAEKAATCTEDGNIAYWYCDACGKYFADEAGSRQITYADTVVKADHIPGAEPTCTEAQVCTVCGEALNDALGHTEETVKGYAPTYDSAGLSDGVKCSVCGEVLVEQTVLPKLKKDELLVEYDLAGTDTYLQSYVAKQTANGVVLHNNPTHINTTESGYTFLNVPSTAIPGYTFLGWYDGYGDDAVRVRSVAKGETGVLQLVAKWSKNVYTITYDSPDVDVTFNYPDVGEVNYQRYTVDTGAAIKNPEQYGYTFIGWSNDDGFIVNEIKPGTTGNMTLHANWTSNRNKATSYSSYGKPIIIEDAENGQFLFVYDIGRIDNVPLSPYVDKATGKTIGINGAALDINMTYTVKEEFSSINATEIAKTVADATTRSSGWTLSSEWNEIYEAGNESSEKQGKSEERIDSNGNTVGGNYFVSNSKAGSSYVSTESGSSSSSSARVTTEDSKGINTSYDATTDTYADAKLSVENKTEVGVSASFPIEIVKVGAEVKNTTTVGTEVSSGRKDHTAVHADSSSSSFVGTDTSSSSSAFYNSATSNSSSWNSEEGYENSYETSTNSSVSSAIANEIAKTTTYNITNALTGANSQSETVSGVTSNENGYSNSITVSEYTSTETTKHIKYSNSEVGYYRLVTAGTVYVYGVVGYDVATSSYYTYTYNVLADDTFEYLDFSKNRATFDDCENGLVTFEIPIEVNEYIAAVTGETAGLEHNHAGKITAFDQPEGFDGTVVIPQYYSVENGNGTFDAYKTTGFDANVFKGNKDIKTVILPLYVTEIPDGAFEGCTSLETVVAYGVTKIGANAFKGCTSLKSFAVDNCITTLGDNAFDGVSAITVMAANASVADAAVNSGATKSITLNLSNISDGYDNKEIVISSDVDYFALLANGAEYTNLSVESDAKETYISNVVFKGNNDTPIVVDSETLTLAKVKVEDAPGFAMILESDATAVKLLGTVELSSASGNAVLSKSVAFSKANNSVAGSLIVKDKYLICGEITNGGMLTVASPREDNIVYIDEETYDSYLASVIVTFDANGGNVSETTKSVYYGQPIGELPTPTRDYYTFLGWYTEVDGGEKVTSDMVVNTLAPHTLYAHWEKNTFTLNFDPNGGTVSETSRTVTCGTAIGTLPTPTREGFTFDGWFDSNGDEITADSKLVSDKAISVIAKWTVNAYTASWNTGEGYSITVNRTSSPNANASTGAIANGATVYYGDVLSVVYSKADYYTITSKGVTSVTVTGNVTSSNIYASAKLNDVSDWVTASSVPSGAQIVNSKWKYTLREEATNNVAELPGYTYYNTVRTGWSDWTNWDTWNPENGVRDIEYRSQYDHTEYHYYRWTNSNHTAIYTYKTNEYSCTILEEAWFDYELPVSSKGDPVRYTGSDNNWANRWVRANYTGNYSTDTTFTRDIYRDEWRYRDPIYVHYFYRNVEKEATYDPSGESNVSNVVKYVQYRAK